MADTTFSSGTVIASDWLNDVNALTYFRQTGGTPSTADTKLKSLEITPNEYGGGVAGIQAALNNAAGRVVRITGNYAMGNTTISVPAGTVVDARGAVLTWTSHVVGIQLLGSATVRTKWTGGKLVGAGNSSYVINSTAMLCMGTDNSPAAPTYVLGPEVDECEIVGWGAYGFWGQYLNGGFFRNSPGVRNIGYGGVCGASCNDFQLYGCLIDTVSPGTPGGDSYGTFFDRLDNPNETAQPRSYRCAIYGNIIKNVTATGNNGQGIDTHGGVQILVVGNTIIDCQAGIYITSSSVAGAQVMGPKNCIVANNTIKSSLRVNYGIYLGGAVNAGVVAEYAEGCVVTGNTVEGHGLAGIAVSGGIRLQATRGAVVSDNLVLRSSCNGILLDADNLGFSISGGQITDPYDNTYASPNCVLIAGNNNTGGIRGISFNYVNGALGTFVAVGSIRINTGLTGLDLDIDRCPHFGLDATHLQYLPITTTGVNASGLVQQAGSATLVAGSVTVTFPKRFPSIPRVFVTNTSDLNPIRAATVTATSVTFGGTGTTAFSWMATT